MAELLTVSESAALAEHEAKIQQGLKTFVDVGAALGAIRDQRLYRAEFGNFEDYAERRWGLTRRRAYQIMDAASSVQNFAHEGLPAPNESQARELGHVPEGDRADVWRETIERTGGKPTAAAIRETYGPKRELPDPEPPDVDADPELPAEQDRADAAVDEIEQQVKAKPAPVMLTLYTHKGEEVPYPQPRAKPTFNLTTGEGISWAAWSWNPVTGCLHGCRYCYARAIIHRYPDANPVGFTPLFHHAPDQGYTRLDAPANTTIPAQYRDDAHESCGKGDCKICAYRRVFVCSMADLYGRWVPDEWINQVHKAMLDSPRWEYLLLTKFPARYVGLELPPNAWVGTSVDEQKRVRIAEDAFRKIDGGKWKWLSLEPLTEPLEFDDLSMFDWVVIGAQTATVQPDGPVEAVKPHYDWVQRITEQARAADCKVHHKPNLTNGKPGMQMLNEYPEA